MNIKLTESRLRRIISEEATAIMNESGGLSPITVGEVRQWKNATVHQLARTSMYFVVVGPEDWSHRDSAKFGGKISMAGSILGAKTGDVLPDNMVGVVIKPVEMRVNKAYELHDAYPVTVPVKIVRLNSSVLPGMKVTEPDAVDPDVEAPPVVDKKQEKQNREASIAKFISDQREGGKTDGEIIDMLMDPSGEFKLSKYLANTRISKRGGMMENSLRTLRRVIREEVAHSNENYKFENRFGFAADEAGVVDSIVADLAEKAKEEHMTKPFKSMNELIDWIYDNTWSPYDVTPPQYKAAAEKIWEVLYSADDDI